MYQTKRSLWTFLAVSMLLSRSYGPTVAQNQETRILELGKAVERELADEQVHNYLIELGANDFLHVIVEQRGVDVVVAVYAPEGKKLKEVDSPNGTHGPEPVVLIAETAGVYRLEVRSLEKGVAGKYAVALTEKRAATTQDREQLAKQALVEQAQKLSNEAISLYQQGRYKDAVPLAERALAIMETHPGPEHPFLATTLDNLAGMYRAQGDYARAALLSRRALEIYEKILGPEHLDVATALDNMAVIYTNTGDYARAELLSQRALAIYEKILGSNHLDTAISLNNLAMLYRATGDYARATPLLERAVAIKEKALGPEHPSLATSLHNLAMLYEATSDYTRAKLLYQRSIAIMEKALGRDHPNVAISLNSLALLDHAAGDYDRAIALLQRSMAINEKVLGPEHPAVASSLNSLALLYDATGDYTRALSFHQRASEVSERNITLILDSGSQQQKQLYLNTLSSETNYGVSLHAQEIPQNAGAARLAITTILRRKGRVLDSFTGQLDALRRRAAPRDKKLLDDLAAVQSELANLQLGSSEVALDARRAEVARLIAEQERLEDDISRQSAEFRAVRQPVTLERVQAAMPTDAALVELFIYEPFNAKARGMEQRYGPAQYVAYVVHRNESVPQFVDLGEARPIDASASQFRNALKSPKTPATKVKQLARDLDARLMQPIRKLLGNTRRVLLAPDGALNLIPFEALVDENGHYLIESYSFNYLTSGRDLLRLQIAGNSESGASIVANPQFDLTRPVVNCRTQPPSSLGVVTDAPKAKVEDRGTDFTQFCYSTLAGSAQEAAGLVPLLRDAKLWTQQDATEAVLKSLARPRVLHIATHGFFLPDQSTPQSDGHGLGLSANNAPPRVQQWDNPLLRSGLILAGVNQRSSGPNEDGVLTALEAAGLNLFGTKLVVLSACETGLGDVQNGQGVYGLRRALVLAGSETQIISLWKVSDDATRALMMAYYKRLQVGEGRVAAMRAVQLEMLKRHLRVEVTSGMRGTTDPGEKMVTKDFRHPYYWAAFIQSGDWRNMEVQE